MTNVMAIAASGMRSAERAFGAAAAHLVSAGFPTEAASPIRSGRLNGPSLSGFGDLATPMVDAMQAANSFRASLALFRVGERMTKTAIDALA